MDKFDRQAEALLQRLGMESDLKLVYAVAAALRGAEAEAEKRGMERAANISDRYGSSYFANLIRAEMERKP